MTKRWAERFNEEHTDKITEGSTEILSIWRTEIAANSTLNVTRQRDDTTRRQAVILDCDTDLRVGETVARRLILWSDSSPQKVVIDCHEGGNLSVWNAWVEEGDTSRTIHAWTGCSGMVVVANDDTTTFGFSDGADPADITKFIVEISIT